jgi:hypothetical protein
MPFSLNGGEKAGGRFEAASQKTCTLSIQRPFAEEGVVYGNDTDAFIPVGVKAF